MELLYMKISDLLLEPDLDFLRFPKHKTGYLDQYNKAIILWNYYIWKYFISC